jgi:6-phosphogluconolactonase
MRVFARIALSIGLLALAGAGAAFAPAAAAAKSGADGYLYVNDNTAGANNVAGFARHADGTLTPLSGSPFSIGGAGTGAGTGSQGALQQSADGRYLLAADAGSNQISVLRIKPDGRLTEAEGSPVWSGGNKPISIAVHDDLVYVANAGDGASNYTGFTLNAGGHLSPLADSTFSLPDGSSPGNVLFNGDGTRLVGTRVNTSLIDSFVVGSSGRLTAAPGSPYAAQGQGPFGSEFSPTNASQLFVSNAHDGAGNGTISAFGVAGNGTLSSLGSSPFADHQTAPCWVEISHDGTYLFAVNTASSTISRFQIAADGTLTLLGSTPFSGKGSFDARLAPDGGTLWVVNDGSNTVSGFAVSGGDLAELASSPTALPAGATPFGIVVT